MNVLSKQMNVFHTYIHFGLCTVPRRLTGPLMKRKLRFSWKRIRFQLQSITGQIWGGLDNICTRWFEI
jgi:hypothetical protein